MGQVGSSFELESVFANMKLALHHLSHKPTVAIEQLGCSKEHHSPTSRQEFHRPAGHGRTRTYSKMKLTLTALTIAASLIASGASACDPEDLQKLMDTNECESCDLTNVKLAGANLAGANLEFANLEFANLTLAYLVDANLRGADVNADLRGANLAGANLTGTNLKGAYCWKTTMPNGSVISSEC